MRFPGDPHRWGVIFIIYIFLDSLSIERPLWPLPVSNHVLVGRTVCAALFLWCPWCGAFEGSTGDASKGLGGWWCFLPKARKICSRAGCLETAVRDGRCRGHGRKPWANVSKRNQARPRDWGSRRRFVIRRDRGLCRKCGGKGTEVDHIVPVALGGSWEYSNLWLLCKPCHKAKTLGDFISSRRRRRRGRNPS